LDTFDGFPLKERIKKRIKEANAGKQVQQAMQLAQVLMMLQQQGIDLSQLDPQKLVAMSQQMQAPTGPAQAVPGQNPPVEGNPVPPQG
jgi:hypothetical protein